MVWPCRWSGRADGLAVPKNFSTVTARAHRVVASRELAFSAHATDRSVDGTVSDPQGIGMEGDLQRCLGRSLRALRAATGLSQEELADQLGIHRTYVGGLERGERNVTLQTVERLADSLGVPALTLLDGSLGDIR